MSEKVEICRDLLGMLSDLINFVTGSTKRLDLFEAFLQEDESVNLRKFYSITRTLRPSFLRPFAQNYSHPIMVEELNNVGAKASEIAITLSNVDTHFMLKLLTLVFSRL